MRIELRNITYDFSNPDGSMPSKIPNLPTVARIDDPALDASVTDLDDAIHQAQKHVEGLFDWLVSGFEIRVDDGEWRRHDEDMSWRRRATF